MDKDRRIAERLIKTGLISPAEIVIWIGPKKLIQEGFSIEQCLDYGLCPNCKVNSAHKTKNLSAFSLCWCCSDCNDPGTFEDCETCNGMWQAKLQNESQDGSSGLGDAGESADL